MKLVRSEFILGGQKSGKSRRAEDLAAAWLAQDESHSAVLIATAQAHDDEMRARIARHRRERALRVPRLQTLEPSGGLPQAMADAGGSEVLRIVDCLTLWLTAILMPAEGSPAGESVGDATAELVDAVARCPGPVLLVGNEIGLGVIPLGREVRAFVDALGVLNQQVAAACERVTLMVAGVPLVIKGAA